MMTMRGAYITLALFVCVWDVIIPFTDGLKDAKSGESLIPVILKKSVSGDEIKGFTNPLIVDPFFEDDNETLAELGVSPPPADDHYKIIKDTHNYYNSSFILDGKDAAFYWIDLDGMPEGIVISHSMLSDSHRQATTVVLSFDFPFYGNKLRNITIATGGFLYMGEYLHNWIAATQYIAPLMANFDTSLSSNSTIKYADNGTTFTVQWNKVAVKDKVKGGYFTFQVTLYRNGDIVFAYKEIPYSVLEISDVDHPVKIGLSDAYIMERRTFFVRRKTIFEYHRIDFLKDAVSNNTAIYFTALQTCLAFHDCQSCLSADKELNCVWCDAVKRCSDGVDRQRQSWLQNGCLFEGQLGVCPSISFNESTIGATADTTSEQHIDVSTMSPRVTPPTPYHPPIQLSSTTPMATTKAPMATTKAPIATTKAPKEVISSVSPDIEPISNKSDFNGEGESVESYVQESASTHSISPGAIVAIIVILATIISVGFWISYAYKFPQSSSGQFLIKYRPSQWNLKPEESGYNSASFHM